MRKLNITGLLIVLWLAACAALHAEVLLVADEFPAMEALARKLKAAAQIDSRIIAQDALPADLQPFSAVVVYLHFKLTEKAELAFIDYTRRGGKLVVLHHSISSLKRGNREWFSFLGVSLPEGGLEANGYKWIEKVDLELVNLAPDHFITTHAVQYPGKIQYTRENSSSAAALPGVELKDTEVYLNHVLTRPKTILLGVKYSHAKNGKTYLQDRAGWLEPAGKGMLIYLQSGHSSRDFDNPVYGQIVANAIAWQPK